MPTKFSVLLVLLLLMIHSGCATSGGSSVGDDKGDGRALPAPSPGLSGTFPTPDGSRVNLAEESRGIPTLVVFWATWCVPCQKEIPLLNGLTRIYSRKRLRIIAISSGESLEDLREFVKRKTMHYTVVYDPTAEQVKKWEIDGFPANVLLDGNGTFVSKGRDVPTGKIRELVGN